MYVLDLTKLEEGDILLMKTSDRLSTIMEQKTGCRYHHAILYVGESSYIHSDKGPGVQSGNVMRMLFANHEDIIALRLKDADYDLIKKIVDSARSKVGTEYSGEEAKLTIAEKRPEDFDHNRQFCTRLVAQAYNDAGVNLVADPNYCSPQDLISSHKISVIKDLLRVANDKEIAYAQEENTILDRQVDITNSILQQSRDVTQKDIQTLVQLTEEVLQNQHWDEDISKIIKESGYLTIWEHDLNKNSYNYDIAAFENHYPREAWSHVGRQLLAVALANLERYLPMWHYYKHLEQIHPLEYIKIHSDLYETLVDVTRKMKSVGLHGIQTG